MATSDDEDIENVCRTIAKNPRVIVETIGQESLKLPSAFFMVLAQTRITKHVDLLLIDEGILEVLKGVMIDPSVSVDHVDDMVSFLFQSSSASLISTQLH